MNQVTRKADFLCHLACKTGHGDAISQLVEVSYSPRGTGVLLEILHPLQLEDVRVIEIVHHRVEVCRHEGNGTLVFPVEKIVHTGDKQTESVGFGGPLAKLVNEEERPIIQVSNVLHTMIYMHT